MIKVIKKGVAEVEEVKQYKITCKNCGCIFLADTKDDIKAKRVGHPTLGNLEEVVNCPTCDEIIFLSMPMSCDCKLNKTWYQHINYKKTDEPKKVTWLERMKYKKTKQERS